MRFTNAASVTLYLPAIGTPGSLNGDLLNPTSSSSGSFGGEVVTLKLNVDYSDANLTGGTAAIAFGDVFICGAAPLADMSVRDFLAIANAALGGGSTGYTIPDLNSIAIQLNAAFPTPGIFSAPSTFAQDHLFAGACP